MPPRLSPYDVEQQLAAELDQITDAQVKAIVAAWALAWSEVSADLFDALNDVLAGGGQITAATIVRVARLQETLAAIADRLEDLTDAAGITITSDLDDVLDQAVDGTARLIGAQVAKLRRSRPPSAALAAIVRRTTEQITSDLLPVADETYAIIQRELIRGVAAGDNPRETARRMVARAEEMWNFGRSRAENIARTEMLDAYRAGAAEGEKQYAHLLAGWAWLCHLGPRTCRSCLSMHGRIFDLDVPGPEDHQQGRCSRCPVVKGQEDMAWLPSAAEHFDSLAPEDQEAILGRKGYRAWLAGDFPIEDWAQRRENDGWRNSYVPAQPGGPNAAGDGTTPPSGNEPPGGGDAGGPDDPDAPVSISERVLANRQVRALVDRNVALIDQAHLVPSDMRDLDVLPLARAAASMQPGLLGFYLNRPTSTNPFLQIKLGTGREDLTFVHELGHAIDNLIFGDPSAEILGTNIDLHGEFADWWTTVQGSSAVDTLERMLAFLAAGGTDPWSTIERPDGSVGTWIPSERHVQYLLKPPELFARAYFQWIATESGDNDLLEQLRGTLQALPAGFTLLQGELPDYPVHWTDEDFRPIAEALRRLFEARGLLPGSDT